MCYDLLCIAFFISFMVFSTDIEVMECLSRTFDVKTVPLQVPYLGPDVSPRSFNLF